MFEEIEKASNGLELILAPQNHPKALLSFVWDATAEGDAGEAPEADE